jgi:hypothetical protein
MDMHLSRALSRAMRGDIDVIHTHEARAVEFIYGGVFSMYIPIVMTLHASAKEGWLEGAYRRWSNLLSSPMVHCTAISEYQKRQYNGSINIENVVYHGIEVEEYPVKEEPDKGSYLFTIGRITRDKGQDKAIELAKKTGSKLIIAGCIQNKIADREFFAGLKNSIDLLVEVGRYPVDNDYYNRIIKPLLDCDKQIIYIGELNSEHKKQWYSHARVTLFPIQWGEPFGLVLIEVTNLRGKKRQVRFFFNHDFHLYGNDIGDTAYFDPRTRSIIHYKAYRYFLINCSVSEKCGVDYYACGDRDVPGGETSWKVSEDGQLSGNPISWGSADSTIGILLQLPSGGKAEAFYWVAAGTLYHEVTQLTMK